MFAWLLVPGLALATPTTKVSTLEKYVRELASAFAVRDLREPLKHFCAAYLAQPLGGDSATIREVVRDLFVPLSDVNGRRARWTRTQVDTAFENGCRRFARDPQKFVDTTASVLRLTKQDLTTQIKAACTDLGHRLNLEQPYPGTFDHPGLPPTLELADAIGLTRPRLRSAMTSICRDIGRPITLPPSTTTRPP